MRTYSGAVLNINDFKPSDETDNSSDSDEDLSSTEQRQQSTESTMTCDICNASGFAPSCINRHIFYCRKKHLAAI